MKKQFLKRVLSLTLVAATLSAATAEAAFTSRFTTSRPIGVQTTYYHQDGQNSSGLQKANYIEYTPNTNVSPVIAYGNGLYGRSTITRIANFLENKGMNVLGGINADFFVLNTGIPIGLVINNGVLISSDATQYAVGFMSDGTAIINKPSMNMKITGQRGEVKVDYYNKSRSKHGIYLLDSNFSNETKISTSGSNILLERLDNAPVTVGGTIPMKVISVGKTSGTSHIYSNQMVLTVSDDGPVSRWVNYQVGDTVTLTVTPPEANAQWKDVVYAVGGKPLIVNGVVTTASIDAGNSKAPRSAVGVKADGTVVLYEIDGRQSSYSVGLTALELGAEMANLGCVNAMCLDGGGSSSMIVQKPGNSNSEVVTRSSDGSLRACANFIMLVNRAAQTGTPAHLAIYPDRQYAIPGATVELSMKATDDGFYPVAVPSDITYAVDNNMGTVTGTTFTAGEAVGTATIQAASSTASGSYDIFIQKNVDAITLKKNNTVLSSLSLAGGESVDLDAYLSYHHLAVASNDHLLSWSVQGNIGSINEQGVLTASNSPSSGKIVVSYNGVSASIPVTIGLGSPQATVALGDFEGTQPFTPPESTSLSVTTQPDKVYRGYKALKVDYNFGENDTILLSSSPISVAGMSAISLWENGLSSNMQLTALFADSSGSEVSAPLAQAPGSGYINLTGTIPEGAVNFIGLSLTKGSANKGTFYIDQIIASELPINNADYPKITITQAPSSVSISGKATIKAQITAASNSIHLESKNIKVTVDGTAVNFSYDTSSATLSVTTPALSAGIHRVTIEAVNSAGNRSRTSVDITAAASSGSAAVSAFSDTKGTWADSYINFIAKQGVIEGEKKGDASYFSPLRNLTRSEFAVIMARYLGLTADSNTKLTFADSSKIPSWAQNAVKAVSAQGIMTGSTGANGKSYFNPSATITRGEVMTVISKSLVKGYAVQPVDFTDSSSIPAWALSHVKTLVSMNLVSGYTDGSIKAGNSMTRAEISKILYGLY